MDDLYGLLNLNLKRVQLFYKTNICSAVDMCAGKNPAHVSTAEICLRPEFSRGLLKKKK